MSVKDIPERVLRMAIQDREDDQYAHVARTCFASCAVQQPLVHLRDEPDKIKSQMNEHFHVLLVLQMYQTV